MAETWSKKENEDRKAKKKKEKEQRKEERKANSKQSKSFEDMIVYVDEDGNFTTTPPDPTKKKAIKEEDIQIGVARQTNVKADISRKGIVTFFNDSKGYGFIKDSDNGESIFVHVNGTTEPIKEGNKVTFEVEMGMKGLNAVRVKIAR